MKYFESLRLKWNISKILRFKINLSKEFFKVVSMRILKIKTTI